MIYEFFGLPGSGKSYIAEREFGYAAKSFSSISQRLIKYFLVALYEVMHPIRSAVFILAIIRETQHNRKLMMHKLKFLYLNAEAREQAASFKREGVVDEGLVNYLLSLYERKISTKDVQSLLKRIPKKRTIYIVNANFEARKKRMKNRNRIPRASFGKEYAKEREEILEHNFDVIKQLIKKSFTYKEITNN